MAIDWMGAYQDIQTLKAWVADLEKVGLSALGAKIDGLTQAVASLTALLTTQDAALEESLRKKLKASTEGLATSLNTATKPD